MTSSAPGAAARATSRSCFSALRVCGVSASKYFLTFGSIEVSLWRILPQIDRFRDSLWPERECHLPAESRRGVRRVQHLLDDAAGFAIRDRCLFAPDAPCEMSHLLREPVIPVFFEYGIRPAFGGRRLFDGIPKADFGIGRERIAHQHVGVGLALVPEHLDAVVHAAGPVPAVLDNARGAVVEFDDRNRLVFALRPIAVHLGGHLRVDALDLRLSEKPPAERDAVTPQIHHGPAPRLRHVPEPVCVRARVLLPLLDEMYATEGAFVRHLLGLHILWREE